MNGYTIKSRKWRSFPLLEYLKWYFPNQRLKCIVLLKNRQCNQGRESNGSRVVVMFFSCCTLVVIKEKKEYFDWPDKWLIIMNICGWDWLKKGCSVRHSAGPNVTRTSEAMLKRQGSKVVVFFVLFLNILWGFLLRIDTAWVKGRYEGTGRWAE